MAPRKKTNDEVKKKTTTRTRKKKPTTSGKVGAPRRYDPLKVAEELDRYIDETEDPMIEEFCLPKERPSKDTLYRLEKECEPLSYAIKKCHAKQQIRTVRNVERGMMNPTWAIFKMKQPCYGWTDKQEIEHSGQIASVKIVDDI